MNLCTYRPKLELKMDNDKATKKLTTKFDNTQLVTQDASQSLSTVKSRCSFVLDFNLIFSGGNAQGLQDTHYDRCELCKQCHLSNCT